MLMQRMVSVLKFGGSSVASATNMSRVLDIVEKEAAKGKVVLVSSAISGCTDALLKGDEKSLADMEIRHRDIVTRLFTGAERKQVQQRVDELFGQLRQAPREEQVTYGEILSTTLLCAKLQAEGIPTLWLDSRELVVKSDEPETFRRFRQAIEGTEARIYVAPGFICRNQEGKIDTLGRGGSDYSAALFAAAIGAGSLQIWTDVPGFMTANPKQVPAARTIPRMSYAAALDMASHGAKVLYAPTVAPAMAAGIDIEIRNTPLDWRNLRRRACAHRRRPAGRRGGPFRHARQRSGVGHESPDGSGNCGAEHPGRRRQPGHPSAGAGAGTGPARPAPGVFPRTPRRGNQAFHRRRRSRGAGPSGHAATNGRHGKRTYRQAPPRGGKGQQPALGHRPRRPAAADAGRGLHRRHPAVGPQSLSFCGCDRQRNAL